MLKTLHAVLDGLLRCAPFFSHNQSWDAALNDAAAASRFRRNPAVDRNLDDICFIF